MRTYTLSDVHRKHGEVFDHAAVEPVIVTKQNRPSHVIVGADLWKSDRVEEVFRATKPVSIDDVGRVHSVEKTTPALALTIDHRSGRTILRRVGEALSQVVISVSDARQDFSAICNRVAFGKERVVIGRHGKTRVAVIPYEDLRLLEELEDRLDLRAARAALKEAEDEGTVAWDDAKRELGL